MVRNALVLGLLVFLGGCTEVTLRDRTGDTTNTLTDLQYRQILDNVARFHDDPDSVPSFAVVTAGTVSVNDQAGAGVSPTYSPTLTRSNQGGGALPILSLLFPISGQRTITENWSLTPITDADSLRRVRCAYRLLVMGDATPNCEYCVKQIKEFFAGEEAGLIDYFPPRSWYTVGGKNDVPKDACYVGRHGATYVWVMPPGRNELALFTMGTLDLATGKLRTPQRTIVQTFKGEPKSENLVETRITTAEDDTAALEGIRSGRTRRPERARVTDTAPANPGLLMLPRP